MSRMKRASAFTERESTGYRRTNPVSTMLVRRAELAITDAGCAVMQAAAASDQRTALGLGTAATQASTAFAAASHDHVGTECLVDDADFAGTLAGQGIKDLQTLAAWLDSNLTPP